MNVHVKTTAPLGKLTENLFYRMQKVGKGYNVYFNHRRRKVADAGDQQKVQAWLNTTR